MTFRASPWADGSTTGPDVETLSFYSDYRRVNSVLRPFRFVERNLKTGQQMNVLQWTTIVANLPIFDAAFHPPTSGVRPPEADSLTQSNYCS